MSECTFLHINPPWLRLTACIFFLAIVLTKQCWYCRQNFHSYTLPCLHTASCHNYTRMNMCIWLWCVAKDCHWLSNSTLSVILILVDSMTEHVLGPNWWGCTASALSWSWGSMTWSLHLILSLKEINIWFFCVCEKLGKVLLRIPEGTGSTWKNYT